MISVASLLYGDDGRAKTTLITQTHTLLAKSPADALGVVVPASDVAMAISGLLAMPVGNLALLAWNQHRRVRQACEETQQHPGSRQVLRMLEHTVRSTQQPRIDVEAGPINATLLTLTVQVDIVVNAIELVIEGGHITEVRPGAASATAALAAGQMILARRQVLEIDLGLNSAGRAA